MNANDAEPNSLVQVEIRSKGPKTVKWSIGAGAVPFEMPSTKDAASFGIRIGNKKGIYVRPKLNSDISPFSVRVYMESWAIGKCAE